MKTNNKDILLTREEFKKQVFTKTNGKCCVPGCDCDAVDAHHIMDRKLWKDGGYYLTNGAALCEKHHWDAEKGNITPKQCLDYMNISVADIKVPDTLKEKYEGRITNYRDFYISLMLDALLDKWGKSKFDSIKIPDDKENILTLEI